MNRRLLIFFVMFVGFIASPTVNNAQETETCQTLTEQIMIQVAETCDATERNQACYGYNLIEATSPVDEFTFDSIGDIVNVADIETLSIAPVDLEPETWGVALMRLQANLPDTLPGQNVSVVIFGDVNLQNRTLPRETVSFDVTANSSANVRSGASTNDSVIGSLSLGDTVLAMGRNEAGDWIQILLEAGDVGWVFGDLLDSVNEIEPLPVVDGLPNLDETYTPMQAFYFQSGVGNLSCSDLPTDGILLQTPQGVAEVSLVVNEVRITLGSTAMLDTEAGDSMRITTVEGEAEVTAEGETVVVPEGATTTVPLDEDGVADGAPEDPQPYDAEQADNIPTDALPDDVPIADPADEATIQARQPAMSGNITLATYPAQTQFFPVPDGDFAIETVLNFAPSASFQGAGLSIPLDSGGSIELLLAYCGLEFSAPGNECVERGIYLDALAGVGIETNTLHHAIAYSGRRVYLRLQRIAGIYTAQYRPTLGVPWVEIATFTAPSPETQVGIVAQSAGGRSGNPFGAPSINAFFESFIIIPE